MKAAPNFLKPIIERKRVRLDAARRSIPLERQRRLAQQARLNANPHTFLAALRHEGRVNIIAEFKRASPSKGIIREGAVCAEVAAEYERAGASAISVLTEEDYFSGSLDDLRAARCAVSLPLLRKDFIFDEYQLYEAAEAGADALLLIAAALEDDQLRRLRRITEEELKMDALVEAHTIEELGRAIDCGASIVGVNNRNLCTLNVSLDVSIELASRVGGEVLLVSESGIHSADDIRRLREVGYRGFLIGELLMRAERPGAALRALMTKTESASS